MMNKKGRWFAVTLTVLAAAAATWYFNLPGSDVPASESATRKDKGNDRGNSRSARPVPVQVAVVSRGDTDVTLSAPGTVNAHNTALVRARVGGQLTRIAFHEGQTVKEGALLAELDARPFQAQLDQALGQQARDEAQWTNARLDLQRYRELLQQDAIARQQVDAQEALVRQYEGTLKNDHGLVEAARLQLEFTRIRAPFAGRLGLRLVDVGNLLQANDANGITTITQTRPINVVFALPADRLADILTHQRAGRPLTALTVEALDNAGTTVLARGRLASIDNQVDVTTGTVKLKAEFANADEHLFPNQFVQARLHLATLQGVLQIPAVALQRGAQGPFVHVVDEAGTVHVRPVTPGIRSAEQLVIQQGLQEGERVVIDGADKLRDGAAVEVSQPGMGKSATSPATAGHTAASGKGAWNGRPQ